LIEARLLADQSTAEIAAKCRIPLETIEAYSKLFFDIKGHEQRQVWAREQLFGEPAAITRSRRLGEVLRDIAMFRGSEALEEAVAALLQIEGPTWADGLPERGSSEWLGEVGSRLELATGLLPLRRRFQEDVSRSIWALAEAARRGQRSKQSEVLVGQALRSVRLTAALRRQIAQLRRAVCSDDKDSGTSSGPSSAGRSASAVKTG
jgi:hypothetical protein